MDRLEQFSRAVLAIHEAAANPDGWETALSAVMQVLEAPKGGIIDIDSGGNTVLGMTALGHDPEAVRLYAAHYYAVDPTMRSLLELAPSDPGIVYELFPARLRTGHEYFDFARSADIGDAIAFTTHGTQETRSILTLQRSFDGDGYDAESKRLMALIAPHLEMAKRVQARLAGALAARSALAAGLDRFATAAFILDGAGTVLHLNAAARKLLTSDAKFRVRHGKLTRSEPVLSAAIERALHQATGGTPRSTILALPHSNGVAELVVSPVPPSHDLAAAWQIPLALMVVSAPRSDTQTIARRMQVLYGLTVAEANVMADLATGRSVEEIASARGVREPTVRSQVRSLFAKVGVSRQADLVRLALSGTSLAAES